MTHLSIPTMLSVHTVLLLFLFALIAIVGSINGQSECDSSYPSQADMSDEQSQRFADGGDRFNRMTLDCQTTTNGGGGGNKGSIAIINISVGLFFLVWVAVGIWVIFVRRQKAMNAAAVTPYLGDMGAREMSSGMDEKTKSVTLNTPPTGKLSNGDTNV